MTFRAEDAAAIRSMIEHENVLLNDRINWLVTIQGLLFAALSFNWNKSNTELLITVLSLLGITASLSAWTSFDLSNKAKKELVETWDEGKPGGYEGPDVIGKRSFEKNWVRHLRPWYLLPKLLILSWLSVLYLVWINDYIIDLLRNKICSG